MRVIFLAVCLSACAVQPGQTTPPEPTSVRTARAIAQQVHSTIAIAMPVWAAFVDNKLSACQAAGLSTREEAVSCLGLAAHSDVVARNMEVLVAAQELLAGLLEQEDVNVAEIGAAYIAVGESLKPLIEPFRMSKACQVACEKVASVYNL